MQLKAFLFALSATGAMAQLPGVTDSVGASVLSVLATAIPPDSVSLALTDPGAFSSMLASALSAGSTPSWYQALPSDVKSYLPKLYPASTVVETTASETGASSTDISSAVVTSSASISASVSSLRNSSSITSVSHATLSSTGGANSAAPSSSSTGGAAYPSAVVGAGLAGALGFLGMLAL
ncbi:uncharacterized protein BDR25DRAFT_313396 [Lindgomyces ingoldianus]|uniref:Uncharacterized protein n=1 Tax=Lindgomyces ingoldianus TaxID=673940 RepID=A0ACB6QYY0_9PLEO|nr:uncharacterized protein BDR25DRAFT_313396 [Lindgomyces ingoldianus]KAF2472233.1 hypothetical protein BDR25DRAFT_313396 [Lindgomyces ingoldianus]